MSDVTNDELTAALTRLYTTETSADATPVEGSAYDRQQSAMFSVLYLAALPRPDNADEQLVHDALKASPFMVFCAARSVVGVAWREAMGLPATCDA